MTLSAATPQKCPFCKSVARYWPVVGNQPPVDGFDCEAVCGQFFISENLRRQLDDRPIDNALLNCIAENIRSNSRAGAVMTSWHAQGEVALPALAPDITVKRFESFAELPIVHSDKTTDLLMLVAGKLAKGAPFEWAKISLADCYRMKMRDFGELDIWLHDLLKAGLARSGVSSVSAMSSPGSAIPIGLTALGWKQVFQNRKSVNSKAVFIAMQFDWGEELAQERSEYIEAVKAACRDCGYEALLVSDRHHINQVTDQIIANIKSARFMVADFTFNNRGAYYEAGLARGLGIPVIHTVKDGHTEGEAQEGKLLHFDIRQINYLKWSTPSEVRERLRDWIRAVIEK